MTHKPATTITGRLKEAAEHNDEALGILFIDRREETQFFSWPQIQERAIQAAYALHAIGLRPGDRVGIILPTCVEFMDSFFGCELLGAVPIPMYPPVRLGRMEEYIERSTAMLQTVEAKAIISNARVRRVLGKLSQKLKPQFGLIAAEKLDGKKPVPLKPAEPDDIAMAQFSSGTTRRPKAVALTHRQILANVDLIINSFPVEEAPIPRTGCSWLPLYHDMGLIGCLFPAVTVPPNF